jgi:hypothetical protein
MVSPQSVVVEATDAATQEVQWKRVIPLPGNHPDSWINLETFGSDGISITEAYAKHPLALLSTRDGNLVEQTKVQ